MRQKWRDLFFIHWEVDSQLIQDTLPKHLTVDTYANKAYIGLVLFKVFDVRIAFLPPLPCISSFLEINVRTYVYDQKGMKGIWFYSLDANSLAAVTFAKHFFFLPYIYSEIACLEKDHACQYILSRKNASHQDIFPLSYQDPAFFKAIPGTLEHFLIERYVLFTEKRGSLFSGRVSHAPYDLTLGMHHVHPTNPHLLERFQVGASPQVPLLFSPGVDVKVHPLIKEA